MEECFKDDGVPLSRTENEEELNEFEKHPDKRGLVVGPEDIQVGGIYATLGFKGKLKKEPPTNLLGQAFTVKVVQLPYLIVNVAADHDSLPLTLDIRDMDFMRVSNEFAKAQIVAQRPKRGGPQE